MYTAKERIERDGYLVAYAGETMSDEEARRRGLIGHAAKAETAEVQGIASPSMDEAWAEAAGMEVEELRQLWAESPSAVLDAIKANLNAQKDEREARETEAAAETAKNDGEPQAGTQEKKPTAAELRAECEARGIKAPKNATIAQLQALLEG